MQLLKEQLILGQEYTALPDSGLRDAAAAENKISPIHRWVPWIAGFSGHFVDDVISTFLPNPRPDDLILDPFAGVGTTLVEALKEGCNTVGYEINPFAALASRAKIGCAKVDLKQFARQVAEYRKSADILEAKVDKIWETDGDPGLKIHFSTLYRLKPPHFRSRIPFFSPPCEVKFLNALKWSTECPEPSQTLFKAALGAVMVSFSNYSYEPSLSSRPGAGKTLIENSAVADTICKKLEQMAEDIAWVNQHYSNWGTRLAEVHQDSYFDSCLPDKSVSLVITSPPYMNNYHYIRNTRPQLHWLSLLTDRPDLRQYESGNFGKFWQTVRQSKEIGLGFEFSDLHDPLEELRGRNPDRGHYGGAGWANYVATYFNDVDRLMKLLAKQLKPGGHAVIVVGNSIIQGIEFKVDQLLARVGELNGLEAREIKIVRTKRVGNSIIDSAVRNGNGAVHKEKTQLYDAAVILRA